MQVQFKIPVTISGVTYGKGPHNVPPEVKEHWFFDALLKDGNAIILRDDSAEKPKDKEPKLDLINLTVTEVESAIEQITSADDLQVLLDFEQENRKRVGVISALQDAMEIVQLDDD